MVVEVGYCRWVCRIGAVAVTLLGLGFVAQAAADLKVAVDISGPFTGIHVLKDYLWLGTPNGVYRCHMDGSVATHVSGIVGAVRCFSDDGKDLLVGTNKGLFRIIDGNKSPEEERRLAGKAVTAIATSKAGLWIGTPQGLLFLRNGESPIPLHKTPVFIHCLAKDGTSLLVGTKNRIEQYDGESGKIINASLTKGLTATNFKSVHRTLKALWFSAGYPRDKKSPGVLYRKDDQGDTVVYADTGLALTFVEANGMLWVAAEKGLFRVASTGTTPPKDMGLGREGVVGECRSGDTLWIVTEREVFKIDGLDGRKWDPKIQMTATSYLQFTDSPLVLRWHVTNYERRTAPKLIRFRVSEDGNHFDEFRAVNDPGGFEITINKLSPGLRRITIEAEDLHGKYGKAAEVSVFAIHFPLFLGGVAVIVLATTAPFAFSVLKACRWALVTFGLAKWRFVTNDMAVTKLTVLPSSHPGGPWTLTDDGCGRSATVTVVPTRQNFPNDFDTRGSAKTVLVRVNLEHFPLPWAESISDHLVGVDKRTVAGQLALNELGHPGDRGNNVLPSGPVMFAGLACLHPCRTCPGAPRIAGFKELRSSVLPEYRHLMGWPDSPWRIGRRLRRYLRTREWRPNTLCDLVGERLRLWGAAILRLPAEARIAATAADFLGALQKADIVHVLAHGGTKNIATPQGTKQVNGLCFQDDVVTANELRPILPNIRCRLLVLSACKAGALVGGDDSFVFPLVSRGVHVLAATELLDYCAAIVFFSAFYQTLFPRWRAQGCTLAEAIRAGGTACVPKNGSALLHYLWKGIDTITLYGNPATNLHFSPTFRFWSNS